MLFEAQIKNGFIKVKNVKEFEKYLKSLGDCRVSIRVDRVRDKRTLEQNNALHLYFKQLAEALNDAGFDMKKTMKVDIPWTAENVKEFLWKPVQRAYLHKNSTTELRKQGDIDKVYDIINRALAERTGVSIPFPSVENMPYADNN